MIIHRDFLGGFGIIIKFNDHALTWETDTIPMKDRDETLYTQ
jgi:hypothetical protein